jgi:hypothetical protein
MAKKLDFSKFKKPNQSILVQMESEKKQTLKKQAEPKKQTESNSPKNKSKSGVTGRPKIGDEIITKRFSLGFTEKEYNSLKEKANRVNKSFIKYKSPFINYTRFSTTLLGL